MYGQISHFRWHQQNSFSTALLTSYQTLSIINENIHLNIEALVEQGMYKRFAESPYHEGKHFIDGTIEMDADDLGIGWLLKGAMGRVVTTSGSAYPVVSSFDGYAHVFVPLVDSYFDDRSALPPNTIEVYRDAGNAFRYFDMLVNRLTFEGANGELLKVSADFLGTNMTRVAATTPIYPEAKPFIWDQSSVEYGSALVDDLRNFTISINNNLEAIYTLRNSRVPYRIRRGKLEVEMSGTMIFNTHSYQQAFEDQSETPFTIHFKGVSSASHLMFDFPLFRFTDFAPVAQGDGIVEASFTGRGVFSVTSDTPITVTLANTQTYYTGSSSDANGEQF